MEQNKLEVKSIEEDEESQLALAYLRDKGYTLEQVVEAYDARHHVNIIWTDAAVAIVTASIFADKRDRDDIVDAMPANWLPMYCQEAYE